MSAPDPCDLARFVEAQASIYESACSELRSGCKQSHWMWFVFPQLRGLGQSATSQYYGLRGRDEARAYLQHPTLAPRLIECTRLVNTVEERTIRQIFGSPDELKFRSCMTLFGSLPHSACVFGEALSKYFAGVADPLTCELLEREETQR
jgi:uncharacterized protein (DUF1810 family)